MGKNCSKTYKIEVPPPAKPIVIELPLSNNYKENTKEDAIDVIRVQELPIQVDLYWHSAVHFNN